LDALETSGQLIDIVTGKTATLTTGDMEAQRIHICGRTFDASDIEANYQVLPYLWQSIQMNCDAQMQMQGESYKPIGSPVDVGLLQLVSAQGIAVQDKLIERERDYTLKLWIPFSSDRKIMTTAYQLADDPETVRVFVKGAPERIVGLCSSQLIDETREFNGQGDEGRRYLDTIESEVIIGPDAAPHAKNEDGEDMNMKQPTGLKSITFAFRDIPRSQFDEYLRDYNKFENEEDRQVIESGLTLLATVGLSDTLREGIDEAIEKLREGGTNIRLFSGDHKASVMSTATQLDLCSDMNDDQFCYDGEKVLAELKGLMKMTEDTEEGRGKTWAFETLEAKKTFRNTLKKNVIMVYRATPELKHMFVAALRQSKSTVGVTGEGLGDARALSEANVGFTMGEDGCSAAKDHADIILTKDDFFTVLTAIRWGRNLQDNVRKFVQFQLTVNISCLFFVITTTTIVAHCPFTVVQLLWINLIMDVLAAIAFATENPHPENIRKERIRPTDRIVTKAMMRTILSQSLYMIVVMLFLMYAGPAISGRPYNLYQTELVEDGKDSYRMLHQTFMFHCFVLMNLFNMVNCRILDPMPNDQSIEESNLEEQSEVNAVKPEYNIFTRPFSNLWFWIIIFVEFNLQYFLVGYQAVGNLFSTTPLTPGMHITAFCLGLGSWIVAAIVKSTGAGVIRMMPEFGEDEAALEAANSTVSKISNAVAINESVNEDFRKTNDDE